MISSDTNADEEINMDTLLPTYLRSRRAYTFPPLNPHTSNDRTRPLSTNDRGRVRTWYHYTMKNAKLITLIIGIIGIMVAIVGIIVATVVTVVVK